MLTMQEGVQLVKIDLPRIYNRQSTELAQACEPQIPDGCLHLAVELPLRIQSLLSVSRHFCLDPTRMLFSYA